MKRRIVILISAFLLAAGSAGAQDPSVQEDLRFVRELRARHYNELALEFLERLRKTVPEELAQELPIEIAKTQLEAAADEPDSGKRLGLYAEAQAEFEKFLAARKGHPRSGEVQLDLAQVAVMRGRT